MNHVCSLSRALISINHSSRYARTSILKDLENKDVIERVPDDVGTPWVSPITAVPKKDGGVRICVDMRQANEAIRRVRHPIPTVDDISFKLNGATCFSKLDLSQVYHQLELHPESRYITTFITYAGLYRYKRLHYGTNASAEIFQYTLQTHLQGLNGVANIADDIIVFGANRTEHDENLDKCLKRLSDRGFTLNGKKSKFLENNLEFFGHIFSGEGTRPDPKRVADLENAPKPSNTQEIRSLLGLANYSSKYIPDFATITAPLRELTKKNAKFEWNNLHQEAFEKVTNALSSEPCHVWHILTRTKRHSLLSMPAQLVYPESLPKNLGTVTQNTHERRTEIFTNRKRGASQGSRTFSSIFIWK